MLHGIGKRFLSGRVLALLLAIAVFAGLSSRVHAQEAEGEWPKNKAFTLTKQGGGAEQVVGSFDTLNQTISAMDINDKVSIYTIYLNHDMHLPNTEVYQYRSNNKIRLTSGAGGPYTLTKEDAGFFIAIQTNATLTIDNIVLDGNEQGECLFISDNGKVTLGQGATIQNFIDSPTYDGPAIYLTGGGTLEVQEGALIQNNTSNQQGGVIQGRSGSMITIRGGKFIGNQSLQSDGGAIAAYGDITITGGVFENNVSKNTGGAILIGKNANATIQDAVFKGNQGSTGGAIYGANHLKFVDTTFEGNKSNFAGAVYAAKDLNIIRGTFKDNIALKQGGAVYHASAGKLSVEKSTFIGNQSNNGGGAIFIAPKNTTASKIENATFSNNRSPFGGGIYLNVGSKLEVDRTEFNKNQAAYGGAISIAADNQQIATLKTTASKFTENTALHGGAIYTGGEMSIESSTFKNNKALLHEKDDARNPHLSGVGGAIYVMQNATSIKSSAFEQNEAYGSGGAIGINGVKRDEEGTITGIKSDVKVDISEGTKFIGNKAQVGQGGAIYTIPYKYENPIQDRHAYKNLTIDNSVVFSKNKAAGTFIPPDNYKEYTNLAFKSTTQTGMKNPHDNLPVLRKLEGGKFVAADSLLNNDDVNYKNYNKVVKPATRSVVFTFESKTPGKTLPKAVLDLKPTDWKGEEAKTIGAVVVPPVLKKTEVKTPDGTWTFLGWEPTQAEVGMKDGKLLDPLPAENEPGLTFVGAWKYTPKAQPKPEPKSDPELRIVKIDGNGKRISLPVTFKITNKDFSFITRTATTDKSGIAKIGSLVSGNYELEEIQTPEGYIPLEKPIAFALSEDNYARVDGKMTRTIYVKNEKKVDPTDVVQPIGGARREDVAVNVSKMYFGDARKVIIVQDRAYADSMSAMNISKGEIPILYTKEDRLFEATREEILRTGRDEIIVVGGPRTVSEKVFKELEALNHGKVHRVDGLDRYAVNQRSIVDYMPNRSVGVFASGMIYTDALSSVPLADQMDAPIVLVKKDSVPPVLQSLIQGLKSGVIVGGPMTISEKNAVALEQLVGADLERIGGANRYVVSAAVGARLNPTKQAIVTSGEKWSDALIAGPVAQKLNAPVLLTKQAVLPQPIQAYVDGNQALKKVVVIGGPDSVGEKVLETLRAIVKPERMANPREAGK